MSKQTEALKMALDALEDYAPKVCGAAITAIKEALAHAPTVREQPAQDNTYNYAKSLAEAIFKQHFASDEHYASGRIVWGVNDTVIGILTQIDNMVADMVRRPAQQWNAGVPSLYPEPEPGVSIKATYEQPAQQQEPVAIDRLYIEALIEGLYQNEDPVSIDAAEEFERLLKTPASPPASKPWVGLTDWEREKLRSEADEEDAGYTQLIKATEAKLREKNT